MARFVDTLNRGAAFREVLAKSHLHVWRPGCPVEGRGTRTLIGVATYSLLDLYMLDQVDEAIDSSTVHPRRVDVFDVSECRSMADLEGYVPGIGEVFQTPIVGIWDDGAPSANAWGAAARDLIGRLFGIEETLESFTNRHYQRLSNLGSR